MAPAVSKISAAGKKRGGAQHMQRGTSLSMKNRRIQNHAAKLV
jgi:hypothetical protein